jgi:serine protease AprX
MVTVSAIGGSVGNVTLTVGALPAGTTATIVPNPVGSPGSSTLTVKTTSWTPRGTFTLQITGTAGALAHQTVGWLTVH